MTADPTLLDDGDAELADEAVDPNERPDQAPAAPPGDGNLTPAEAADNGSLSLLLAFVGALLAFGVFRSWWIPGIVVGLLFMLFMHELGHYLTARASGMKVTEFFLGFGPKIWSFNKGETEYGVKGIPAGAYVRIIGMTNLDDIDPAEEHRTYRAQPYWQRMITICAGSAMHFLMALVALVVLFGAYGYQGFNGPPWEVREVVPGSAAAELGVELGDRILEFQGTDLDTWQDFTDVVTTTPVGPIELVIERDGQSVPLQGELGARSGDVIQDGFGLFVAEDDPSRGWNVVFVAPDSPAERVGFAVDDLLVSAGSVERPSQRTFANELITSEGQQIAFGIIRDGQSDTLAGVVELDRSVPFRGFFGVGYNFVDRADATWAEAPGRALSDFGLVAETNVNGLIDLVNPASWGGDDSQPARGRQGGGSSASPGSVPEPDDASGNRPVSMIGIARLFAESESVDEVLFLFMLVNIFIGIFNLVPLLPLDGGHAAIATYERIRELVTGTKHRVDAAKLVPITWAVILLLVGVGLWAAALDIFAWPA